MDHLYCECGNAKTRRAKVCKTCACRAAGKKGFAATTKKYGEKISVKHVQAYNLAHPSKLEAEVAGILDTLGVTYQREVWLETKASGRRKHVYLIDFMVYLDGREFAIEVQGGFHGRIPEKTRRDRRKKALITRRGYPYLAVHETTIKEGRAEVEILKFLGLVLELSTTSTNVFIGKV